MKKSLTAKQKRRIYRNQQIRIFYDSIPEDFRSLKKVAIAFGVSEATVSRVINNGK